MDPLQKKIWKRILKGQLLSLVIISIIVIFFIVRSGSLAASLTVGVALFLASFRFTYSEYQQYKREFLEQERQEVGKQS